MLSRKKEESLSKFMSKILRHTPDQYGIDLNHDGYCEVSDLLASINREPRFSDITLCDIEYVVKNCKKQRYELIDSQIRANYGHSIERLSYEETFPPEILYHGTNKEVSHLILNEGIKPMGRNYAHLSESIEFAELAGKRRGELVIIEVKAREAAGEGIKFYHANSGVWLSDFVPSKYLKER